MPGVDPSQRGGTWLLDFDVGGRMFRFATKAISVTSTSGNSYRYEAGLVVDGLGSVRTFARRDVRVVIHSGYDWPQLEARGVALENRRCVLRWHVDEAYLENARRYLDGRSEAVEHNGRNEPLRLRIREDIERSAVLIPGSQGVANDETWPVRGGTYSLAASADGKPYPVVIGYPGTHPKPGGGTNVPEPAVFIPWVEEDSANTGDRFLVSTGVIDAAQARIYEKTSGNTLSATDTAIDGVTVDKLGQLVSYIELGINHNEDNTEFWLGFKKASGWGGGIKSPYRDAALHGMGEVLRFLLDFYTDLPVDHGRMAAFQDFFDRFKIDAAIGANGPELSTDWAQKHILEWLPALLVDGDRGLYAAPIHWDAQPHHAVAHINLDKGHAASSRPPRRWREQVYNKFTVEYRPRWGSDYVSRRILTSLDSTGISALTGGAPFPPLAPSLPWIASSAADQRVEGSELLRASQARFGVREYPVIKLPACWDDETATLIMYYLAAKHAWPKREWSIRGGHHLSTLEPGNVIKVTYSDQRLDGALAIVMDRVVSQPDAEIPLVLLDSPNAARLTT